VEQLRQPLQEVKRVRLAGLERHCDQRSSALPQPHARAAAVLVDELNAGLLERALNGEPCRVGWRRLAAFGTTIGLMAVSLTHLSDGVTQLTAIPAWQG
jgi:hypothetical protein